MSEALAQTASIAVTVFAVSSMLSVGLAYTHRGDPQPAPRSTRRVPCLGRELRPGPAAGRRDRAAHPDGPAAGARALSARGIGGSSVLDQAGERREERPRAQRGAPGAPRPGDGRLPPVLRAAGHGPSLPARPLLCPVQRRRARPAAPLDVDPAPPARPRGEGGRPALGRPARPDRRQGGDRRARAGDRIDLRGQPSRADQDREDRRRHRRRPAHPGRLRGGISAQPARAKRGARARNGAAKRRGRDGDRVSRLHRSRHPGHGHRFHPRRAVRALSDRLAPEQATRRTSAFRPPKAHRRSSSRLGGRPPTRPRLGTNHEPWDQHAADDQAGAEISR